MPPGIELLWTPPGMAVGAMLRGGLRVIRERMFMPLASLMVFRSLRLWLPASSSSLTENALWLSPLFSEGTGGGTSGRWGELAPISSSPLRPIIDPSTLRRLGLMGGTGGACMAWRFGVDAAAPMRLPERDRDPLLDLDSDVSGRATVGTREVDETKVGSEMSFFLTTLFIDSSRRFTGAESPVVGDGAGGMDGRRDGTNDGVDWLTGIEGDGIGAIGETGDGCPE